MSLVTLNSNGQAPHFFSCHFPQPIHLKPYSQVCLLKFLHFRDTHIYNITSSNNLLLFCIGNTTFDGIRQVRVPVGQYSGAELATALQDQMNAVLQQQHYEWTVTFIPEDDTTSPPTKESFTISYASLTTPAEVDTPDADMSQLESDLVISSHKVGLSASGQALVDGTTQPSLVMNMPKGVLTDNGSVELGELHFSGSNYIDADPDNDANFGFDDVVLGMCRTELASRVNENPNLVFDPDLQDVAIKAGANGLEVSSIKIASGRRAGSVGYASQKLCRTIPNSAFKTLAFTTLGLDANVLPVMRFRLKYTTRGANRRVICQIQVDDGQGGGYTDLADGAMGNDAQGNPFVTSFTAGDGTVFPSTFWVSDQSSFNDLNAGGTSQRVQNVMITKKAPFLPTCTFLDDISRMGPPELTTAGLVYQDGSANAVTITDYSGSNGYTFKIAIPDAGATEYYLKEKLGEGQNPLEFDMSVADVPFTGNGKALYNNLTDGITITLNGGGAGPVLTETAGVSPPLSLITSNKYSFKTILNPNLRPLTSVNVADGTPALDTNDVVSQFYAEQPDVDQTLTNGTTVGADLSRQAILFLRQLTTADVSANSGSPANLRNGQASGTIGSTIGSVANIIVGTSSTGQQIFASGQDTQRVAKDTIITIQIPELAGVKSFNGIDQGAGQKLSGEGKNIAVLPREEFEQRGENTNGSLVYVSPFENWIDINNGADMYLNQLTCEVRQPAGQLATDLRPDTITQIKFRQDPMRLQEARADKRFEDLALSLSSAVQTGQILSKEMYLTGS